jgi:ABC-type transport system involved in cytochrome c biogenesis permease subunit
MKHSKSPANTATDSEARLRRLPEILLGLFILYLLAGFQSPKFATLFNLNSFGSLPVLNGGRIKPLDTIARTSLLILSGKQTLHMESGSRSAIQWLMDVMFNPGQAASYPVFTVDNPDVLGTMGITQTNQRRYSFADLEPHGADLEKQATQIEQVKPELRSRFQTALFNLQENITLYQKLQNTLQAAGSDHEVQALQTLEQTFATAAQAHAKSPKPGADPMAALSKNLEMYRFLNQVAEFFPLPEREGFALKREWRSFGQGVLDRLQSEGFHPGVMAYAVMGDAYRDDNFTDFNQAVEGYTQWLVTQAPQEVSLSHYEFIFNYYEPFYKAMLIYLVVFLLICASWLTYPRTLIRAGFYLLVLAFVVHTVGLVSRMYLQGRPPVTNLYSSAIFVGWVAVLLGIVLERFYRNGIGSMVAAVIGFMTLIIAHHLASSGDTLEMMRAVLDSNFWLATHVVCVTIGYGSTFLSGFLGTLYIFRRIFDPHWDEETAATLERMVYGIVCFATLFSFVGTILGGIWADQSWGRFWGWDPKENGALMIVLWNVFILHARWGGLAKQRTLMVMVVFGNIVTSLSWFGVNMLGIGLHSYGFMDKAFVWLIVFDVSQLAIMALGLLPDDRIRRLFRSTS